MNIWRHVPDRATVARLSVEGGSPPGGRILKIYSIFTAFPT